MTGIRGVADADLRWPELSEEYSRRPKLDILAAYISPPELIGTVPKNWPDFVVNWHAPLSIMARWSQNNEGTMWDNLLRVDWGHLPPRQIYLLIAAPARGC